MVFCPRHHRTKRINNDTEVNFRKYNLQRKKGKKDKQIGISFCKPMGKRKGGTTYLEDSVAPEGIQPSLCQPIYMYEFIKMSKPCHSCFVNFSGIFAHTFRFRGIFVGGRYRTDLFKTVAVTTHVFCTTPNPSDPRSLRHAAR